MENYQKFQKNTTGLTKNLARICVGCAMVGGINRVDSREGPRQCSRVVHRNMRVPGNRVGGGRDTDCRKKVEKCNSDRGPENWNIVNRAENPSMGDVNACMGRRCPGAGVVTHGNV